MKKFFVLMLTLVMVFSALTAGAASVPAFMEDVYNSYTADYKFSMTIGNADEVIALLNELEMPEEVNNFIDVKALIESLCTVSSVMKAEVEMDESFRKIKASLTAETDQVIVFNRNYDTSYSAKLGIWLDMDLDSKRLVVVYATPLNDKYAVIDFAKDAPQEVQDAVFGMYDGMLNRDFMKETNKKVLEIAMKHADVTIDGDTCIVKYDNEGFTSVMDEIMGYVADMASDIFASMGEEIPSDFEFPSFKGIQFLGEDGITCTYKIKGGKIKRVHEKMDMSVSVADIYTKVTGSEWTYNSPGTINFAIESTTDVSKVGTTHPVMPELTAENSFSLVEFDNIFYGYGYEYGGYLMMYVWGETDEDIFDGERYYFPLRTTLEEAYWDCVDIAYDNGMVTVVTDCDEEEDNINVSFKVGEDTATVNGVVYEDLGVFKTIDGIVYASRDFYEKALGWTLTNLEKDIINGVIDYGFRTGEYEEYDEEEWIGPAMSSYVWGYAPAEAYDGDSYYMPLRYCIDEVYWGNAVIEYKDGFVTVVTDCGDAAYDINASFNVGEDTAVVNGTAYDGFSEFKIIENSVYADKDFYEKCLGWKLDTLCQNLIDGEFNFEFITPAYTEY